MLDKGERPPPVDVSHDVFDKDEDDPDVHPDTKAGRYWEEDVLPPVEPERSQIEINVTENISWLCNRDFPPFAHLTRSADWDLKECYFYRNWLAIATVCIHPKEEKDAELPEEPDEAPEGSEGPERKGPEGPKKKPKNPKPNQYRFVWRYLPVRFWSAGL